MPEPDARFDSDPLRIYVSALDNTSFPAAPRYHHALLGTRAALREPHSRWAAFPHSERHLQCVWYDPALRPEQLETRNGDSVRIEHPGIWNREAGPDFIGAVIRIGPDERRVVGDVEIHIHPADWHTHGHDQDPAYNHVRLHVTYFAGSDSEATRIPGAQQVVLKHQLAAMPGFSFEHIDPSAYPYAARADRPPCSVALDRYHPDQRIDMLRAAGQERLRRKAERMAVAIEEYGADQVLYEEVMSALGYKHNKTAFRHVARMLPLDVLQEESQGQPRTAYALLMGIAGLLPKQPRAEWAPDTAAWMRALWDIWWRYRDRYARRIVPPTWRWANVRPANHPARRLMAAAQLWVNTPALPQMIHTLLAIQMPEDRLQRWLDYVARLRDPYVSARLSLSGRPQDGDTALLGPNRAASIYTNVLIPYWAARGAAPTAVGHALDHLPRESNNHIIKQTAFYLFGPDHSPTLYKDPLARQGLIQIFHDFCLNDRTRCAACPFPAALEKQRESENELDPI